MKSKSFFVMTYPSVVAIDFKVHKQRGVSCVLFDIEGTLTPWGEGIVSEEIKDAIISAGIEKIGIVSNMHKTHSKRAHYVGEQISASSVMIPLSRKMRKPSAAMVLASLQRLQADPEHTILVGDKLIDVLTAKNAHLAGTIWVSVMPGPDHWFDRHIYRKVEPRLKQVYTKRFPIL